MKIGCIVIFSNGYSNRQKYVSNLEKFFANTNVIFKVINGIITDKPMYDARFHEKKQLSKGQIGCALAHFNAVKLAKKLDLDYVFIFEDDVEIIAENYDVVQQWLDNLPKNDICLITNVGSFEGVGHDGRIHSNTLINDSVYMTCPFGAQVYYISKPIINLFYETQLNMIIKHNKIHISDGLPIYCEKENGEFLDIITPQDKDRFFKHSDEVSIIGSKIL